MGGDHWEALKLQAGKPGSPPHGRGPPSSGSLKVGNLGSPPHGRGPPAVREWEEQRGGLTPAWAGTTHAARDMTATPWAHPRMGGDHSETADVLAAPPGSPPHGRGPLLSHLPYLEQSGLTPAWAGTTQLEILCAPARAAHPRMGGDHMRPLVRLKHPAAHPRMGGDHSVPPLLAGLVSGSPPHGRGPPSATCWFRRVLSECPVLMDCQDARQIARRTGVHPGR